MELIEAKRNQLDALLLNGEGLEGRVLTVAQVMTPHPTCIELDVSAYDLVQLFHTRQFRHPLVVDRNGRFVGVISDRDVLRCFGPEGSPAREELEQVTAEQLMSTDVITIGPQAAISEAVTMMLTHGINCLPVVDDGRLCGIVTSTDLYLLLERMMQARGSLAAGAR